MSHFFHNQATRTIFLGPQKQKLYSGRPKNRRYKKFPSKICIFLSFPQFYVRLGTASDKCTFLKWSETMKILRRTILFPEFSVIIVKSWQVRTLSCRLIEICECFRTIGSGIFSNFRSFGYSPYTLDSFLLGLALFFLI